MFDYEAFIPTNARVEHILPGLKDHMLTEVASDLGCVAVADSRRKLRGGAAGSLLGILTTRASDVIDDQSGQNKDECC